MRFLACQVLSLGFPRSGNTTEEGLAAGRLLGTSGRGAARLIRSVGGSTASSTVSHGSGQPLGAELPPSPGGDRTGTGPVHLSPAPAFLLGAKSSGNVLRYFVVPSIGDTTSSPPFTSQISGSWLKLYLHESITNHFPSDLLRRKFPFNKSHFLKFRK